MLAAIVSGVFIVITVYPVAGIIFTIFFQIKGLSKIDEGVHGSTIGFRIIIIPGCIVFWPRVIEKMVNDFKQSLCK
jgi:hypothetical protein